MIARVMGFLSKLRETINSENVKDSLPNAINSMTRLKEQYYEITNEKAKINGVEKQKTNQNNIQKNDDNILEL